MIMTGIDNLVPILKWAGVSLCSLSDVGFSYSSGIDREIGFYYSAGVWLFY